MSTTKYYICPVCLADDHTMRVHCDCYPKACDGGSLKISIAADCIACNTKWLHETIVKPEGAK
jgi:hypothetical protein